MPTSVLTAAGSAVVSAGASKIMGGLFGGDEEVKTGFTPSGINAGGLKSTFGPDGLVGISADANRMAAVNNIANTFGQQADQLGALRPLVAPGMSGLRSSRLGEVENARLNAIGNLRENLGRRRVLGSSFAQDANTRAEAEFAQQAERVQAETFLQELEMTQQVMQQEFTARRGQFQTGLDELNLEANLAAGLAGKATDALQKNSQVEAMLSAQSQQGAGKFFGQLAQPIGDAVGKGIKGLNFGGSSGGLDPSFGLQF